MPHALAAHLGASYLDTTLIADDALETDALVFAARAFPVLRRTKDALAEQAVLLRAQGAIVDGLRLRHLAIAPRANLLGAGQADTDGVKIVNFKHWGRREWSSERDRLRLSPFRMPTGRESGCWRRGTTFRRRAGDARGPHSSCIASRR